MDLISKIFGMVVGHDGEKDSKGFSRKWLAILAPCVLQFSGHPVPREMWAGCIAYVLGQSYVDAKNS